MTNLEWLARNADDLAQNCFFEFAYFAKHGKSCDFAECKTCTMGNIHELIKALNEDGGFLQFDLNYLKTKFFDLCPSCVKEIDQFLGEPKQFEEHEEKEDGR